LTLRSGSVEGVTNFDTPSLLREKVVAGQPYSANRVLEHSQVLADGTHINKCSDPQAGDNVTGLEKVERTDPDPALFEVPADYTVVDEVDRFRIDLGIDETSKER
jgi:hypothetical protein